MTLIHENELDIPNRNNTHSRARRRLFQIRHATDPCWRPYNRCLGLFCRENGGLNDPVTVTALVMDLERAWKMQSAREHLESTDSGRLAPPPSTTLLRPEIVNHLRDTILTCLILIL